VKAREVTNQAVADLTAKLKELKQSDEDDLGKLAGSFDEIASQADQVAEVLNQADQALTGNTDEEEPEPDEDQQPDNEEPQQ
jgi:hypothetical protein